MINTKVIIIYFLDIIQEKHFKFKILLKILMVILKLLGLYLCIARKTMLVILYLMGQVICRVQNSGYGFDKLT